MSRVLNEDFERAIVGSKPDGEDIVDDFVWPIIGIGDQRLGRVAGIKRQETAARLDRGDVAGDGGGIGRNRQPVACPPRNLRQ